MGVITVASTKGGVGKSTVALNLATALLKMDRKVAILDADSQGTLVKWSQVRDQMADEGVTFSHMLVEAAKGEKLLEIALAKREQGHYVILDSPGADDVNMRTSLLRSDVVLTVCSPSPVELWEIERLIDILSELAAIQKRRIPLLILFNRIPTTPSSRLLDEARQFVRDNYVYPDYVIMDSVIKERVAFRNSIRMGCGVVECMPSTDKAVLEVNECVNEMLSIVTNYSIKEES